MRYLEELEVKLAARNIHMRKCNDAELAEVKENLGNKQLPKAYLEFLSIMGNGTDGKYLGGDSCFLDELFDLEQGAVELLEENESECNLSENDFVFWMTQGCMFCFFRLNEGNNPPVYLYNEDGDDRFIKISSTLTEFLMNRLEMNIETFREK